MLNSEPLVLLVFHCVFLSCFLFVLFLCLFVYFLVSVLELGLAIKTLSIYIICEDLCEEQWMGLSHGGFLVLRQIVCVFSCSILVVLMLWFKEL